MKTPIALTIAGSDSGGGAGIQADLKTFSAIGVYGASVIAALTAQNTKTVDAIYDVSPEFIARQIDTVCSDLDVDAVKIGMLSQSEVIESVADALTRNNVRKIVLDPVMVAKSGDRLLQTDAISMLVKKLVPLATIITPNLPEAADLLSKPEATSESEMQALAKELYVLGCETVLVKGGHLQGDKSTDVFFDGNEIIQLPVERIETRNTHGTGCTLSSAIAAYLARGESMLEAVRAAKEYVSKAIAAADRLRVGQGHGPVHHFHQFY